MLDFSVTVIALLMDTLNFLLLNRFCQLLFKAKTFSHLSIKYQTISFASLYIITILGLFHHSLLITILYILFYIIYVELFFTGSKYLKIITAFCSPFLIGILSFLFELLINSFIHGPLPIKISTSDIGYFSATFFLYIIVSISLLLHENRPYSSVSLRTHAISSFAFFNILILLFIVKYYNYGIFTKSSFEILMVLFFIYELLATSFVLFVLSTSLRQLQKEHELEVEISLSRLTKEYEAQITDNAILLRSLRHDLKNHLTVINGYLAASEIEHAKNYINEITGQTTPAQAIISSDNTMLSALLTEKNQICYEKQIYFSPVISISGSLLPDMELNTILGNILDNAIDAAEKIPDRGGYIDFIIESKNQVLHISCINNFLVSPKLKHGQFITSKTDSVHHGLGLKNVTRLVNKYNGSIEHTVSSDTFQITILIPLLENTD